ncbi:MAG: protein kinase domain-containing protein [Solimonas sp.]
MRETGSESDDTVSPSKSGEVDHVAMKPGQMIGRYEIVSVLGQGGFGITYRARDVQLGREVAIKEYLPSALAIRQGGTTVLPRSTKMADDFGWGRERFVTEGRTLASLHHVPAIVRVFDFLEAYGTAYIVMELLHGATLEDRITANGKLTPQEVDRVLWPLLDGLEQVHDAGFLHRDIKPANILLDAAGNPTLIDFGASRAAMAGRSTALTAIFTPGYAAAEQMTSAKQGPWTDIYGLSATLYHAIAGKRPPNAFDRMLEDAYEPLARLALAGFSPGVLAGVDAGLTVTARDRPQSIGGWRPILAMTAAPAADATMAMGQEEPPPRPDNRHVSTLAPPPPTPAASAAQPKRTGLWIAAAIVLLALLGGGGYYAYNEQRLKEEQVSAEQKRVEQERMAKEQADRKAKEEADRAAKEEADRKAKGEADLKAKGEADLKAKEEADRNAKEEADRTAKEEAARVAKAEADRKAKEEADRKAKEEADRHAKEEADRKAKEEADRKAEEDRRRAIEEIRKAESVSGTFDHFGDRLYKIALKDQPNEIRLQGVDAVNDPELHKLAVNALAAQPRDLRCRQTDRMTDGTPLYRCLITPLNAKPPLSDVPDAERTDLALALVKIGLLLASCDAPRSYADAEDEARGKKQYIWGRVPVQEYKRRCSR